MGGNDDPDAETVGKGSHRQSVPSWEPETSRVVVCEVCKDLRHVTGGDL